MTKKASYSDTMRADMATLISSLDLDDIQRHFLRSRWLDQVVWMEARADQARRRYYGLRLLAAMGGVIVPTLVSLSASGTSESLLRAATITISLVVALSLAIEELMRFGERFRHYRRTVEVLKSEGWQFFQLTGPYRRRSSHQDAYSAFAGRVERIIQPSVEVYITDVVAEKEEKKEAV